MNADLPDLPEEYDPHYVAIIQCAECGHSFVGIYPLACDSTKLECEECGECAAAMQLTVKPNYVAYDYDGKIKRREAV